MPSVQLTVPHSLGEEEAAKRLRGYLAKVKQRFQNQLNDLEETWVGNVVEFAFKTYGFHIKGRMDVAPDAVKFDAQIPFAAMMFKGKIEQTLRDEMNRILAPGERPEKPAT